jgi:quercetin 2,3-dioxygenase
MSAHLVDRREITEQPIAEIVGGHRARDVFGRHVRVTCVAGEIQVANKGRTEGGDVQVMSAGTGIRHSEYNLEPGTTRIFQIWILPTSRGKGPSWGAKPFPKATAPAVLSHWRADPNDSDALPIRTDARVLGATLETGETAEYALGKTRHGYLVPAKGSVEVNGMALNARDGAAIGDEPVVQVRALEDTEAVLVDAA